MKVTARAGRVAAAILGAVAGMSGATALAAGPACLRLPPNKIGFQLYTMLGDFRVPAAPGSTAPATADPARMEAMYGQLHRIGWRNMENYGGGWGLGDAGYKAVLDRHKIKVVAAHETLTDEGFAAALERARSWGHKYVGSGNYGQPGLDTLEHVLQTAARLDKLGQQAAARGLKFYVHNHQDEFKNKFSYDLNGDGKAETVTAWEIVEARTNPKHVSFEIDVHWARMAMGLDNYDDVLKFLQKHRKRIVLLHIKDTGPEGQIADLGRGTTDWSRLVKAAGPQIGYYLWEYDRPPNPIQSAQVAYNYLTCKR